MEYVVKQKINICKLIEEKTVVVRLKACFSSRQIIASPKNSTL